MIKYKGIAELISSYPRVRPRLSDSVASRYELQYIGNRRRYSFASKLSWLAESWMHAKVASDVAHFETPPKVLEIGAGDLNHIRYEKSFSCYDVVEPFTKLYETSQDISLVNNRYLDIEDLPFDSSYDRIISIATFEHLTSLANAVARSGLALTATGTLRIAVPSEGGLLWHLGWRLTTGLEYYLKNRLDYGEIMRHEHVNNVDEIELILRHFFRDVSSKRLGIGKHFSLYTFFCCSNPEIKLCCDQLSK